MLVLSRKVGEKLVIGRDIIVTVVECRGGRVRLGVDAAPHVPIHREEVRQRIESSTQGVVPTENRAPLQSPFIAKFA